MAAPRLEPDRSERAALSPGGLALAQKRAERGERTVIVGDDGAPLFAVVPVRDMERLRIDDRKLRHAREVVERVAARFIDPDAEEQAMAAALEARREFRDQHPYPPE